MDDFISKYLYAISPHQIIDESTISCFEPAQMKLSSAKKGAKKSNIIQDKCLYLQDTIIRKAYSQKDNKTIRLSSTLLQRIVGGEYKTMLDVLCQMGYLKLGDGGKGGDGEYNYYSPGKHSMLYSIPNNVDFNAREIVNFKIKGYKEKAAEELGKYYEASVRPRIEDKYGESFYQNYLESLNMFKIDDNEGFERCFTNIDESLSKTIYLSSIRNSLLEKKTIYSIDKSGRLYHVLTNLRKDLKVFINIDFELDCKNSNPLLLNYFIFKNKDIDSSTSYNISSMLSRIKIYKNNHNVGKNLRNELISNGIENQILAKLTDDELDYIYLTSTGRLWDVIQQHYPQYTRGEIKALMFEQVFFAPSAQITSGKPFAGDFQVLFPSIYELITLWKKPLKNASIKAYLVDSGLCLEQDTEATYKGNSALPLAMMNLESRIMTEVLKRMYRKRWSAVNIHDCIVVPKSAKKNQPSMSDVVPIMDMVYAEFGLKATFNKITY